MTTSDLERLIVRHLPDDFLRRILHSVYAAHRVAWERCLAEHAEAEAVNLLPYEKRAKLEGYLRDIATLFPQMTARVVRADGSNWNHTEIASGPVVLTENAVQSPCALVEKAEFRARLALSNQGVLFDHPADTGEAALSSDPPLYVLLLHSRSRWDDPTEHKNFRHLPESVYLACPADDLESYLHAIDLIERFPDVVEKNVPQSWDSEARLRYMRRGRRNWAG